MKRIKNLIFSQTSKDTTILFSGNLISSALAIIFTIFVARNLGSILGWQLLSFIAVRLQLDFGLTSSLFRFLSKAIIHLYSH
jgi:hypothetical protein